MRIPIAIFALLVIAAVAPAQAQSQIDAATRQDVEDMMQLTGVRGRVQTVYTGMASSFAASFADRYRQQNPNASPAEIQRVTTAATERIQQLFKAMPTDDLLDAMVPVYQKYLTHSDIKAINEFYSSPTGQKLLKDSNPMMLEAMQAAQAIMKKHMPEIEGQIEKAGAEAAQSAPAQPK